MFNMVEAITVVTTQFAFVRLSEGYFRSIIGKFIDENFRFKLNLVILQWWAFNTATSSSVLHLRLFYNFNYAMPSTVLHLRRGHSREPEIFQIRNFAETISGLTKTFGLPKTIEDVKGFLKRAPLELQVLKTLLEVKNFNLFATNITAFEHIGRWFSIDESAYY